MTFAYSKDCLLFIQCCIISQNQCTSFVHSCTCVCVCVCVCVCAQREGDRFCVKENYCDSANSRGGVFHSEHLLRLICSPKTFIFHTSEQNLVIGFKHIEVLGIRGENVGSEWRCKSSVLIGSHVLTFLSEWIHAFAKLVALPCYFIPSSLVACLSGELYIYQDKQNCGSCLRPG